MVNSNRKNNKECTKQGKLIYIFLMLTVSFALKISAASTALLHAGYSNIVSRDGRCTETRYRTSRIMPDVCC